MCRWGMILTQVLDEKDNEAQRSRWALPVDFSAQKTDLKTGHVRSGRARDASDNAVAEGIVPPSLSYFGLLSRDTVPAVPSQ
jgi:hypothetical protein